MKNRYLLLTIVPFFLLAACNETSPTKIMDSDTNGMEKEEGAMMDESQMQGVVMLDGKMMTIWSTDETAEDDRERDEENQDAPLWNGNETAMMKNEVRLQNEATVMMDGTMKMANGQTVQLQEGDAVMMDGSVKKMGTAMMKKEEGAMMKAGEYKDATATNLSASVLTDGKTKVLFFHAAWCPTCKAANQTLTSWYKDGAEFLNVYKINYDNEKQLKQKYSVTYQHTFVKIDGEGNVIQSVQGPSDEELKDLLSE